MKKIAMLLLPFLLTTALAAQAAQAQTVEAQALEGPTVEAEAKAKAKLVAFAIEDQFEDLHQAEDFAGRGLLVIAADSAGSGFTSDWSAELGASITKHGLVERIDIVGLADLRGVPRFVRGSVRKSFSTEPEDWMLLDWRGVFAETYGFESGDCNFLLFGEGGELLFTGAGRQVEPEILAQFEAALEDGF